MDIYLYEQVLIYSKYKWDIKLYYKFMIYYYVILYIVISFLENYNHKHLPQSAQTL